MVPYGISCVCSGVELIVLCSDVSFMQIQVQENVAPREVGLFLRGSFPERLIIPVKNKGLLKSSTAAASSSGKIAFLAFYYATIYYISFSECSTTVFSKKLNVTNTECSSDLQIISNNI